MRCRICGTMLDPVLVDNNLDIHPGCADQHEREMERRNDELKGQLLEIIHWYDANSARSKQLEIGPSEIGLECDLQVARILAGMPRVNTRFDPWAGIVGTAIHQWMKQAVDGYLEDHIMTVNGPHGVDGGRWLTETKVSANEFISGSSDLYVGDVVDYKSAEKDKIKLMRMKGREAIPPHYLVQAHIYGLGNRRAGRPVRDIVLVFVPRNGLIKDMYLFREKYNENIAFKALDRIFRLADEMSAAQLPDESQNWDRIARTPGEGCWYCPFYVDRAAEFGPDASGCPGNNKSSEERAAGEVEKFGRGLM